MTSKTSAIAGAAALVLLVHALARADGDADPCTYLFDTGKTSATAIAAADLGAKAGWKRLEEDDTTHRFLGDSVLVNDRLAVVLRRGGAAAEVYGRTGNRFVYRLSIGPTAGAKTAALAGIKIVENGPAAVMAEASFGPPDGKTMAMSYRLTTGQAAVQLRPKPAELAVEVGCAAQYALVPDFFGDDLIVGAEAAGTRTPIPAENFFLGLLGQGNALVMCVWKSPQRVATAAVATQDGRRAISGWSIQPGPAGSNADLWIAILEGAGIWHTTPISGKQAEGELAVDWKPPFAAKWRAAIQRPAGIAQSWYLRQSEEEQISSTTKTCPCTVGEQGSRLSLGALAAGGAAQRPLIVYPIDRTRATPLTTLCPIDILRATLGVGPCQYILQTEGLASESNPTPDAVMTWVEKQFSKKKQKKAADDIGRLLDEMTAHMGHAETRLQQYAALARDVRTACGAAAGSEQFAQLARLVDYLDESLAPVSAASKPSQQAAKLAQQVVALVDRKDSALECQRLGRELRRLGAIQDTALARCRLAARCLKVYAAAIAAGEPGAEQAHRICRRAAEVLKSP